MAPDVQELVERGVAAEHLERQALGLDRQDRPALANELRHRHRVDADVRADVQRQVARTQHLTKEVHLPLAVFAVKVQRTPDVMVVDVVHHAPVAALLDADVLRSLLHGTP